VLLSMRKDRKGLLRKRPAGCTGKNSRVVARIVGGAVLLVSLVGATSGHAWAQAGPPSNTTSTVVISPNPPVEVGEGGAVFNVTVTVEDANGNPVDADQVTLNLSPASSISSIGPINPQLTSSSGVAAFYVTCSCTAGTVIEATANDSSGLNVAGTATVGSIDVYTAEGDVMGYTGEAATVTMQDMPPNQPVSVNFLGPGIPAAVNVPTSGDCTTDSSGGLSQPGDPALCTFVIPAGVNPGSADVGVTIGTGAAALGYTVPFDLTSAPSLLVTVSGPAITDAATGSSYLLNTEADGLTVSLLQGSSTVTTCQTSGGVDGPNGTGTAATCSFQVPPLPAGSYTVQVPQEFVASDGSQIDVVGPNTEAITLSSSGSQTASFSTSNPALSGADSAAGLGPVTATTADGSLSATASGGSGAVVVGEYTSPPAGAPALATGTQYFDVLVAAGSAFTSLQFEDCGAAIGATTVIDWYDTNTVPPSWLPVSDQTYTAGPPGCVTVTINSSTTPALADLTGTIFGAIPPASPAPPQSQTISFTSPNPSPVTVDGTYTPTATATSGLPVAFSIDGTSTAGSCSLGSGTVSFSAVGTCVLDANQAGNAEYQAATEVQQTITVKPAPQTITFTAPATGTVGGSALLAPTASSGLPVTLNVDTATTNNACSVSGDTVNYLGSGNCVLDATQAGNAEYQAATEVQQTISVSSAVSSASLAALTLSYVQSSAKYRALTSAQQRAVTAGVAGLTSLLKLIQPDTPPTVTAGLIRLFKVGVAVLMRGGWLTTSQSVTLAADASQLGAQQNTGERRRW